MKLFLLVKSKNKLISKEGFTVSCVKYKRQKSQEPYQMYSYSIKVLKEVWHDFVAIFQKKWPLRRRYVLKFGKE